MTGRPTPSRALGTATALAALWLASCASDDAAARSGFELPGQTQMRVDELSVEGVEAIEEDDLLEGLSTQEDPGWRASGFVRSLPLLGAEPEYFNRFQWRKDLDRIKTYYAAHGYFNATILSEKVLENRPGEGQVTVRAEIREGEPVRVRSVRLEGLDGVEIPGPPLDNDLALREGLIFTQERYEEVKERVAKRLRSRSFAYAEVTGRALIDPDALTADVVLFVDPGPRARFGEVVVQGLGEIDEEYVREAISFEPGELYDAEALQETQDALYDLGIFSLVTVQPSFEVDERRRKIASEPEPDLDAAAPAAPGTPAASEPVEGDDDLIDTEPTPELSAAEARGEIGALGISDLLSDAQQTADQRAQLPEQVQILVTLKPARNWNVRVGVGASFSLVRQDVHAALNFGARNFLGTLGKLEQFNTVGYALAPGLLQPDAESPKDGIFFTSLLRYTQPQLFERLLTGFIQAQIQRDIQETHVALIPSGAVGLRRQILTRQLRAELSYNAYFIRYENYEEDFARELDRQGLPPSDPSDPDGPRSFLLEYLETKIAYDRRDSPIDPTSGFRVEFGLQRAGRYVAGGEYDFIKPRLQMEGYIPYELGPRWVSAARLSIGSIYDTNPPEDGRGIPLQSRLYGGGRGSVRSFSPRYFGYFTSDTRDPGPIGTITLADASIEQRVRLVSNLLEVGDLWGALFLDAGSFDDRQVIWDTAANDRGTVGLGELARSAIYGAGLGVYWRTPIGPVRADLAWTLNDLDGEDFLLDEPVAPPGSAGSPEGNAVLEKLRGYAFYIGIGHSL